MSELFCGYGCAGEYSNVGVLITVDLSAWDTSKVTTMFKAFSRAGRNARFTSIINYWDTARLVNMEEIFFNSYATDEFGTPAINIGAWDTSKVTNMKSVYFAGRPGATVLADWDTSRVTSFRSVFNQVFSGLATQDISGWDTSKATNMEWMFSNAGDFQSDVDGWDTSKVKTMQKTFWKAKTFNSDISRWDTSKVTNCAQMFDEAAAFNQELGWCFAFAQPASFAAGSGCAVSGGDDCGVAFRPDGDCPCVTPPYQFDPGVPGGFDLKNAVALWLDIGAEEACQEFGPIEDWDVSKVTDMSELFCDSGCTMVRDAASFDADLSKWDTGRVTTMQSMFRGAAAFDADVSQWNTALVTRMDFTFYGATTFAADLSKWDTGRVTTMQSMFRGAAAFDANIGGWNTASVTTMENMFREAVTFNQILALWNTASVDAVTGVAGMFYDAAAFNRELGWCFAFAQPDTFAAGSGCAAPGCGVAFCPPSNDGPDGCDCGTLVVEVTPGQGSRRLTSARNGPFLSQLVVRGVRSRPPDRRRDATRRTPRSVGFDG